MGDACQCCNRLATNISYDGRSQLHNHMIANTPLHCIYLLSIDHLNVSGRIARISWTATVARHRIPCF
jgi:hypothetical protein